MVSSGGMFDCSQIKKVTEYKRISEGNFIWARKLTFLTRWLLLKKWVWDGVPSQWWYSTKFCTGRLCSEGLTWKKRYPFRRPSEWYPFYIPSSELCIPFHSLLEMHCLLNMNKSHNQDVFQDVFAFWEFSPTEMIYFLTLSYTRILKKGALSSGASSYRPLFGLPSGSSMVITHNRKFIYLFTWS